MRSFLAVLILAFSVSVAFACGGGCGKSCKSKCGGGKPEAAYTYNSAFYMPDCAPPAMHDFHDKLVPIIEARRTLEESYVRENSGHLYKIAKDVAKSDPCCPAMKTKHFRKAAKELVRDCKELRELSYGAPTEALYARVEEIENDFIQLSNLCE